MLLMWTPSGRMAEISKKTRRYPTDLTDEEWALVAPMLPGAARTGRPASVVERHPLSGSRAVAGGCPE